MDPRVALLKEFYRGLPWDRAKVETSQHGFGFLEKLLSGGVALEYGELTLTGLLHKYKITNVPPGRMDALLLGHVEKACNVCLYFKGPQSRVLCFNLDNNLKAGATEKTAEMELTVAALRDWLTSAGCEPLVVASGRGYHVWVRLSGDVENGRLHRFMMHAAVRTMALLHSRGGYDHRRIKFNFYPDPRNGENVSLRLFGSTHAKTGKFSQVLAAEGLLDEAGSWTCFERHLADRTVSLPVFEEAFRSIPSAVPPRSPQAPGQR